MPQPVNPQRETARRKCDFCAEQMRHVGDIPRTTRGAEVRVFRCDECCLVITETFDPATRVWKRYEFA
jgi:hypothetical protein